MNQGGKTCAELVDIDRGCGFVNSMLTSIEASFGSSLKKFTPGSSHDSTYVKESFRVKRSSGRAGTVSYLLHGQALH